ncbi:MAG: hypothetical protein AAFN78_21000 [Pseudomonadota bacterium]
MSGEGQRLGAVTPADVRNLLNDQWTEWANVIGAMPTGQIDWSPDYQSVKTSVDVRSHEVEREDMLNEDYFPLADAVEPNPTERQISISEKSYWLLMHCAFREGETREVLREQTTTAIRQVEAIRKILGERAPV